MAKVKTVKNERDPPRTWYDGNMIFTLCRMITWVVFLRMFWNFFSSLPVKRGGSLSFLTIFTFAVPDTNKNFKRFWETLAQVVVRYIGKNTLFSVISSVITLEWQKWKPSKMKGILLSSPVSLSGRRLTCSTYFCTIKRLRDSEFYNRIPSSVFVTVALSSFDVDSVITRDVPIRQTMWIMVDTETFSCGTVALYGPT
jgi:hypothetical protein